MSKLREFLIHADKVRACVPFADDRETCEEVQHTIDTLRRMVEKVLEMSCENPAECGDQACVAVAKMEALLND